MTKDEAKSIVARKNVTEDKLQNRLDESREQRNKNRIKIVNLSRPQHQEDETTESTKELTVLDVERDVLVNQPGTSKQVGSYSDLSDEIFVYDIYISDAQSDVLREDNLDINELRYN